ncbi:MAG: NAD-dependent epimerase/dehydratase family protein [Devosia sp.]
MSRVLVTGGSGFVGAWVVSALRERGMKVRLYDLAPNLDTLDFVRPLLSSEVEVVCGDICDRQALTRAMAGCDGVVHLAGLMTRDCAAFPVRAIEVNLVGSQNVFSVAHELGVERVVYASSGAVYGPEDNRFPKPMSLYGTLKLAVEGFARVAWQDQGIASVGFRPYIVYGPGESAGIAAGPSIALRAATRGQSAEIHFSGRVGFVHVGDVARVMVAALSQVTQGAHVVDMAGDCASVDSFVGELKSQRPASDTSISGPPLRMPESLAGGDILPWLEHNQTTSLRDGIAQTLAHWEAVAGRASSAGMADGESAK